MFYNRVDEEDRRVGRQLRLHDKKTFLQLLLCLSSFLHDTSISGTFRRCCPLYSLSTQLVAASVTLYSFIFKEDLFAPIPQLNMHAFFVVLEQCSLYGRLRRRRWRRPPLPKVVCFALLCSCCLLYAWCFLFLLLKPVSLRRPNENPTKFCVVESDTNAFGLSKLKSCWHKLFDGTIRTFISSDSWVKVDICSWERKVSKGVFSLLPRWVSEWPYLRLLLESPLGRSVGPEAALLLEVLLLDFFPAVSKATTFLSFSSCKTIRRGANTRTLKPGQVARSLRPATTTSLRATIIVSSGKPLPYLHCRRS